MTHEEAAAKLQDLLDISRSCKYGYPMDFTDEHTLEDVILHLRQLERLLPHGGSGRGD